MIPRKYCVLFILIKIYKRLIKKKLTIIDYSQNNQLYYIIKQMYYKVFLKFHVILSDCIVIFKLFFKKQINQIL